MEELRSDNELDQSLEKLLIVTENDSAILKYIKNEVLSDSSSSDEEDLIDNNEEGWSETILKPQRWIFEDKCGLSEEAENCAEPIDFYQLFIDDELIQLVVDETNRYAEEQNANWSQTNIFEMKKFITLCLQMGIVRLPKLRDYWSTDLVFGKQSIGSNVMPRIRFENLTKYIHFTNNFIADNSNILYKISNFVDIFIQKCKLMFRPSNEVRIDESIIPFCEKIFDQSSLSDKTQRYDMKLLKLCSTSGFN